MYSQLVASKSQGTDLNLSPNPLIPTPNFNPSPHLTAFTFTIHPIICLILIPNSILDFNPNFLRLTILPLPLSPNGSSLLIVDSFDPSLFCLKHTDYSLALIVLAFWLHGECERWCVVILYLRYINCHVKNIFCNFFFFSCWVLFLVLFFLFWFFFFVSLS